MIEDNPEGSSLPSMVPTLATSTHMTHNVEKGTSKEELRDNTALVETHEGSRDNLRIPPESLRQIETSLSLTQGVHTKLKVP
ncbi:UNVERIFIED_CONTAM: hypothetical protein Slati_0441800 [Sesamum latifolium]|uniref:Uncharacterized protein n=1 Tax=Sesamum latifolium TaxID=2727402 RepID=A0AAW2XZC8_9LAMI